jgi:hypothetical protein
MRYLEKLRSLRKKIVNDSISDKDAIKALQEYTEMFNHGEDLEEIAFITEILRFKKLNARMRMLEERIEEKKKQNSELFEFIFLNESQISKRKEELRILINR